MRHKQPDQYHHGGLREAAVQAALASLDAEQRMPALRHVAAACGVAHSALYRHFASLEALRLAMAAACFRDFARHVTAALSHDRDPYARLATGTAASIRWGLNHRARYMLMMGPELAGKQQHHEFFAAAQEAFGTLVQAVSACGTPDPVPVAHTAMSAIHGLVDLLLKGRTIPGKAASIDEQIGSMVQLITEHVRRARVRLE